MTTEATRLLLGGVRTAVRKTGGSGGVKYGLVKYYPRFPDQKDPPINPTKLLMVQRIKKFKGNPYWHKSILESLHLHEKQSDIAIVKNTPETAAFLWKIKHLIKVTPITTPNGIPNEEDLNATYLHENGTFMVTRKVAVDPNRLQAIDNIKSNWKKMDGETLRKDSRLKWLNPYQ